VLVSPFSKPLDANLANVSALLFHEMEAVNWVGFYLLKQEELVLGPFQGKVACVRIPVNRGVCGVAAFQKQPQVVNNVHDFVGHIACDTASNAEIVIPLFKQDQLIGVLDIDSPIIGRFDENDLQGLQAVTQVIEKQLS
jgi:GAF domain-containing protein